MSNDPTQMRPFGVAQNSHTMMTPTVIELLAVLRAAKERDAEWYRWVEEGKPRLTPEEYTARTGLNPGRPRRSQVAKLPVAPPPDEPLTLDSAA